MNLQPFKERSLFEAMRHFFAELNIPVSEVAEEPVAPGTILTSTYRESHPAFDLMEKTYFLGMVDEKVFTDDEAGSSLDDIRKSKEDYDGLLIFGVTLDEREGGLLPTRSQLAEITRAFNREFHYTPVVVVYRYNDHITFSASERLKYKQQWREGEKAGKVSMLKDIELDHPHRGHLSILEKLKITTTGRNAVRSFAALYHYWQSVFTISVLNKTFYEEIIEWFNWAVKEIRIPSEKPGSEKHKDFTVRLIARLIFIWFLKELKVVKDELLLPEFANGDDNDTIIPNSKGSGYYKFILQNLFFNALNAELKERDDKLFDVYASSYSNTGELKKLIAFSPYLNGGLFDVHPNDWCEEGKVNNAFQVPDELFIGEDGLNNLLASYKFTIAENTPLEEEIAVDPEMLGRIFENLLAEQSEDTKEAARKNKGAFYTPRPVVSYMCRNVLLKHLDTEVTEDNGKAIIHKLLDTTVLDPACGSGAFPMGMLEEMMEVLEKVDPEGNLWVAEMLKSKDDDFKEHIADFIADKQIRYVKKLGLLRNCLFGIDILEYAVEITKLRCWLSLIVEQRVDFSKPNYNLKPLPNLEFKFYQKNSLYRYYKEKNLNELVEQYDNDDLLKELVNLENSYFITKSDRHGTKEEIKHKIIRLLETVVDRESEKIEKEHKVALNTVNHLVSSGASQRDINSAKKKAGKLANELAKLADFRSTIRDYFIESVVFPGIFSSKKDNPGFNIVIGNPPYVNTKLISSQGMTQKLKDEYGYCDDLYNHFTIRGLELVKKGGLLSYITSDTFLTLQTKENMRRLFLGITPAQSQPAADTDQLNMLDVMEQEPDCHVLEIINTPKAFAALVDTAIFTVERDKHQQDDKLNYIDLRYPKAETFDITEEEWKQIKTSKENISGWERVLDKTFSELGISSDENWQNSHSCDGESVEKDEQSRLQKYKVTHRVYQRAISYAIFAPNPYNCQLLEKIVKQARPVFDKWWDKIETSRKIEQNREKITVYTQGLNPGNFSLVGLLTDGGQGLATGNNGRFVGYYHESRFAERCRETRPEKLWNAMSDNPRIANDFPVLKNVDSKEEVAEVLQQLSEQRIWELFDGIKEKYGLRVFGKGISSFSEMGFAGVMY